MNQQIFILIIFKKVLKCIINLISLQAIRYTLKHSSIALIRMFINAQKSIENYKIF